MSGTTGKKATQTTPAKTKKRSTRKKVAKTSARQTRGSTTGVKKKTVKKKPVTKKAAAKKTSTRKVSKKAASSKEAVTGQQETTPTPEQAGTAPENKTPEDTRSLSWMSAQAASALKAVKASQAEKGQTILARTRKQAVDKHIDDDSLIEIAAGMPVDNDGLIEFSTEDSTEEQSPQIEAPLSAPQPVEEGTSSHPDTADDSVIAAEPEADMAIEVVEAQVEPAPQPEPEPEPIIQPPPPPRPAKRSALFHPAVAAGVLFSLLLGYYFWPAGDGANVNEDSAAVAIEENTVIERPATVAAPVPVESQVTTAEDVATVPTAKPEQESPESINAWTHTGITGTREPSGQPQTATAPPLAPTPEPMAAAAAKAKPAPVQATVTQQAQPAAPAPAPVQRNYRAPVYGSYPQQRQPAYPQRYYR